MPACYQQPTWRGRFLAETAPVIFTGNRKAMEAILSYGETPQVYQWRDPVAPLNSPALCVYFVEEPQVNKAVTAETGVQTYDNVLVAYVAAKPQDKSNVAHEIRRTFPDGTTRQTNMAFKFAAPLKNYDEGRTAESLGTPLKELLNMTPATAMTMRALGITTVEVLADLPDSSQGDLMGFWEWRDKAKKYIAHRKENAPMVKLEALEEKHKAEMDALQAKVDALTALVATMPVPPEVPVARRGPGRPPKTTPDQEAA